MFCVLICPFFKKIIVLRHDDNDFLFWHLCQIHTFINNPNKEEMITSHLMRVMKYINSNRNIGITCLYKKKSHSFIASWVIAKFNRILKIQELPLFGTSLQPPKCSIKKGGLRIMTKFAGKHLYQSLRAASLLNKRFWHRCFALWILKNF